MATSIAARDFSVVIVGNFNPAILHPEWFAAQGLIKRSEADASNIEVVHKEVATWSLEWAKLFCDGDRLQITTEQEAFAEAVRDLAVGVLTLLEHTPVRAVGLNFGAYYQFTNRESYDRFGHDLVPKTKWKSLGDPRTLRLVVTAQHDDGRKGSTNITVSAANRFRYSAHIAANDHTEFAEVASSTSSEWARAHIFDHWRSARDLFELTATELTSNY